MEQLLEADVHLSEAGFTRLYEEDNKLTWQEWDDLDIRAGDLIYVYLKSLDQCTLQRLCAGIEDSDGIEFPTEVIALARQFHQQLEQDSVPFAATNSAPFASADAVVAPRGSFLKRGKHQSFSAMSGKMVAMKEKMSAMSGKVKTAIKVPGCQAGARLLEAGRQRTISAPKGGISRTAGQDFNDSESVSTSSSGECPSPDVARPTTSLSSGNRDRVAPLHDFACPSCDAMGAFDIYDKPCCVDDVRLKQACHTCQGSGVASAEVIKCMKCKGLGCLGSWRRGEVQCKSDCMACNGKGYVAAVVRSNQDVGSKRGRNDLGWSLVAELKQLTNASDMERAAQRFGASEKYCSMAALTEAVDRSPCRLTRMAILKAVAPSVFGEQCVVIELHD